MVTSAPGAKRNRAEQAARISLIAAGGNRLGVPPPRNTLCTVRPQTSGRSCSRSAVRAATYSWIGNASGCWCELKSQYGHFRTHHGMWMYSDSGGGISMRHCPTMQRPRRSELAREKCRAEANRVREQARSYGELAKQFTQLGQRPAAMADAVLEFGCELGGAQAQFRIEEDRVVAEAAVAARCL